MATATNVGIVAMGMVVGYAGDRFVNGHRRQEPAEHSKAKLTRQISEVVAASPMDKPKWAFPQDLGSSDPMTSLAERYRSPSTITAKRQPAEALWAKDLDKAIDLHMPAGLFSMV